MIRNLVMNLFQRVKALEYELGLIADYAVERGTSGIWTYRKWASGDAECWGTTSKVANINNAQGNIYTSPELTETYPSTLFTDIKAVEVSKGSFDSNSGIFGSAWNLDAHTVRATVFRGNSSTNNTINLSFHVLGKWK